MVKLNPRPPAAQLAEPCSHCGRDRIVAQLQELIGFQRRRPIPGMDSVLASLRRWYPLTQPIALCPGCMCITADLGAHEH